MQSNVKINPGNNCLEIQFSSSASFVNIHDPNGKLIRQSKLNNVNNHYFPGDPGTYILETDGQIKKTKSFDNETLKRQKNLIQVISGDKEKDIQIILNGIPSDPENIRMLINKKELELKDLKEAIILNAFYSIEKIRRSIILSESVDTDFGRLANLDKELSNTFNLVKKAKNSENLLKIKIKIID